MLENVSRQIRRNTPRASASNVSTQLRRIRAVTNTHRELPPVSMGRSVDEFFEDLAKSSDQGRKLPNWWVFRRALRLLY